MKSSLKFRTFAPVVLAHPRRRLRPYGMEAKPRDRFIRKTSESGRERRLEVLDAQRRGQRKAARQHGRRVIAQQLAELNDWVADCMAADALVNSLSTRLCYIDGEMMELAQELQNMRWDEPNLSLDQLEWEMWWERSQERAARHRDLELTAMAVELELWDAKLKQCELNSERP